MALSFSAKIDALHQFLKKFNKCKFFDEIPPEKYRKLKTLEQWTFENREEIKEKLKSGKRINPQTQLEEFNKKTKKKVTKKEKRELLDQFVEEFEQINETALKLTTAGDHV